MIRKLFVFILAVCVSPAFAQKPKPKTPAKPEPVTVTETVPAKVDSFMGYALLDGMSPYEALEYQLPHETEIDPITGKKTYFKDRKKRNDSIRVAFRTALRKRDMTFYARTVKAKKAGDKTQLCVNIVSKDTNLVYCVPDSVCRDPEVAKVLFEKQSGDSIYMLILIDAFSKAGGACIGEKETKLLFARWNPKENHAIWKAKKIASCATTITNMTKDPIASWDRKDKLVVSYHKGDVFYEVFFDPEHPEKGIQNSKGGKE